MTGDFFSFQVADRDTLTSVAARFDTTPSELTKLNRLATPYIFPGQQLYVPNRENAENESEGSTPVEDSHDDLPPEEKGKKSPIIKKIYIQITVTRLMGTEIFV